MNVKQCQVLSVSALLALSAPRAFSAGCDMAASDRKVVQGEQQSDRAQMERMAREALALCDSNPRAHNLLGAVIEERGDLVAARASYAAANRLDPDWYLPALGIADVARKRGSNLEARFYYDKALGLVKTPEERHQVDESAALLPPPTAEEASGYAYQDEATLQGAFRIGERLTQMTGGGGGSTPTDAQPSASRVGKPGGVVRDNQETQDRPNEQTSMRRDGSLQNASAVYFVVGSTEFTGIGRGVAEGVARSLSGLQGYERFIIEGHASTEGDPGANLDLSKRRAAAFRDFLLSMGIKGSFEVQGHGAAEPVFENGVENKGKSRRVVLIRKVDQ